MVPIARHFSSLQATRGALLKLPGPSYAAPTRGIGMLVARVLRGALKIRYLVLGGSIAGGSALAKVWRESLVPSVDMQIFSLQNGLQKSMD